MVYFGLPEVPGVGSQQHAGPGRRPTLERSKTRPSAGSTAARRAGQPAPTAPFEWADVIAGDIGAIRRYAPRSSSARPSSSNGPARPTWPICASAAWHRRHPDAALDGAWRPGPLVGRHGRGRAHRAAPRPRHAPLTEDTYLDLMADIRLDAGHPLLAAGGSRASTALPLSSTRSTSSFIHNTRISAGQSICPTTWWRRLPLTCRPCTSRASPAAVAHHRAAHRRPSDQPGATPRR
jgi:hypothetical protein